MSRLRGEWDELLEDSAFPTPFHTLDWLQSWSFTLGRRRRIFLATAYEGNDLVGAIPLVGKRGIAGGFRSMGIGPSDYLHPIIRNGSNAFEPLIERLCERGDNAVDIQQVREGILPSCTSNRIERMFPKGSKPNSLGLNEERPQDDGFQKQSTPAGCQNSTLPNMIALEQATCLSLDLPDSYKAYLKSLGKSLRTDCRRAENEFLTKNNLRIVPAETDNISECLDAFFRLHASRWRSRGQPGAFMGRERFHRTWAPLAEATDSLRLRLLLKENEPIAAIYGMKFGTTTFFYQAGMNPNFKSLSSGTILLADLIRSTIKEGGTTFDFLRGDEPYKRRWKPQHAFTNMRYLYLPSGVRGPILEHVQRLSASAERKLRDRLEGKSLKRKNEVSGGTNRS